MAIRRKAEDGRVSMFLRLSIPGGDAPVEIADYLATLPEPTYGGQLQDLAAPGLAAEGQMAITYTELLVPLADGSIVTLRQPQYAVETPGYGPLHPDTMLSPRVTPQMIGLGLLEAIPAADILAHAGTPRMRMAMAFPGRANIVMSVEHGVPMLGRFGLKAGAPTIREQSAAAFAGDMGLSTPLHPEPWGDCTPGGNRVPHGAPRARAGLRDGLEVDAQSLDLVTSMPATSPCLPAARFQIRRCCAARRCSTICNALPAMCRNS